VKCASVSRWACRKRRQTYTLHPKPSTSNWVILSLYSSIGMLNHIHTHTHILWYIRTCLFYIYTALYQSTVICSLSMLAPCFARRSPWPWTWLYFRPRSVDQTIAGLGIQSEKVIRCVFTQVAVFIAARPSILMSRQKGPFVVLEEWYLILNRYLYEYVPNDSWMSKHIYLYYIYIHTHTHTYTYIYIIWVFGSFPPILYRTWRHGGLCTQITTC